MHLRIACSSIQTERCMLFTSTDGKRAMPALPAAFVYRRGRIWSCYWWWCDSDTERRLWAAGCARRLGGHAAASGRHDVWRRNGFSVRPDHDIDARRRPPNPLIASLTVTAAAVESNLVVASSGSIWPQWTCRRPPTAIARWAATSERRTFTPFGLSLSAVDSNPSHLN